MADNDPTFKKGEPRDFSKSVEIDNSLDLKTFSEFTGHENYPTFLEKAAALYDDHHKNNKHGLTNTPYQQLDSLALSLGLPALSAGTWEYIISMNPEFFNKK